MWWSACQAATATVRDAQYQAIRDRPRPTMVWAPITSPAAITAPSPSSATVSATAITATVPVAADPVRSHFGHGRAAGRDRDRDRRNCFRLNRDVDHQASTSATALSTASRARRKQETGGVCSIMGPRLVLLQPGCLFHHQEEEVDRCRRARARLVGRPGDAAGSAVVDLELRGRAVGVGQRGKASVGVVGWSWSVDWAREVVGGCPRDAHTGPQWALEGPGCSVCNFAGRGPGEGSGGRLLPHPTGLGDEVAG